MEPEPPPVTWRPELTGDLRIHPWKYAAGKTPDGNDKSRGTHAAMRNIVRTNDKIRIIKKKHVSEVTTADQKILDQSEKKRTASRLAARVRTGVPVDLNGGNAVIKKDLTPPSTWKPEIKGNARAHAWKHAAGLNEDGTNKTKIQHKTARAYFRKHETIRVIYRKTESARTPEEREIIAKDTSNRIRQATLAATRAQTPKGKECSRKRDLKHREKSLKLKAMNVEQFIIDNAINVGTERLSDEAAFSFILCLIDDTDSKVGKLIFDTLGMTLRTAFWNGKSNSAMYALILRGAADVGGANAECVRFLLRNADNIPVLTHADTNKRFKFGDKAFKDLELVYCPIMACGSFADVTTIESAFQLLFGFLEIGRHRLWKISGQGNSELTFRKVDMKYMKKTNDKSPKFMFGITILKNVSVVSRTNTVNGEDIVTCITGGRGTSCTVNHPVRVEHVISESQRVALIKAQTALPPNFMSKVDLKRKADTEGIETERKASRRR
ncbi:hypothetical protein T484DRAFT_1756938 [Baffinella frigidus]|nr:hypothetical protein T484DRAFT_1756938 [Cryptophyta sp. CCMP2293]